MEELLTDEGMRLKERLREARDANKLLTNQEIADRAGLSVSTVNNYFSNRSKASPAATVGRLCMVLGVSMDAVFGIQSETQAEADPAVDARIAELESAVAHQADMAALKDKAIAHYAVELERRQRLIWALLALCIILAVMFLGYLCMDALNPHFGIFRG